MSPLFSYLGSLAGPEYDWLGHFRAPQFLCEGHNDNDAEQVDETVERLRADRAPDSISDKPEGA